MHRPLDASPVHLKIIVIQLADELDEMVVAYKLNAHHLPHAKLRLPRHLPLGRGRHGHGLLRCLGLRYSATRRLNVPRGISIVCLTFSPTACSEIHTTVVSVMIEKSPQL